MIFAFGCSILFVAFPPMSVFIFSMCILERTPRLMPDKGSMYYPRVQHYRELLDSLPMDAYTHGCILHPELTVDSMIPAYATTRIRSM